MQLFLAVVQRADVAIGMMSALKDMDVVQIVGVGHVSK
jgi:hypothetical protein